MILSAHQPVYLPGIIFFNKLALSDAFVFLSDVTLAQGRSWQTRNRIRQGNNAGFLSVPVKRKGKSDQKIFETRIDSEQKWQHRHVASLRHAYGKRPYFSTYFDDLAAIIERPWDYLSDLNCALTCHLAECFGLSPQWHDSRDFDVPEGKNERLIALAQQTGATSYVSNAGSMTYVDEAAFAAVGIEHLWQHFEHPTWDQGAPFIENLSAIDLLFNAGPDAGIVVRTCGFTQIERFEHG